MPPGGRKGNLRVKTFAITRASRVHLAMLEWSSTVGGISGYLHIEWNEATNTGLPLSQSARNLVGFTSNSLRNMLPICSICQVWIIKIPRRWTICMISQHLLRWLHLLSTGECQESPTQLRYKCWASLVAPVQAILKTVGDFLLLEKLFFNTVKDEPPMPDQFASSIPSQNTLVFP